MNYKEAADLIEGNRTKCFAGVDIKRKELFVMNYYPQESELADHEEDYEGYVCMHYEIEVMDEVSEEETYDLFGEEEHILEQHPNINSINFSEISEETRVNLMDMIYSYQLEILGLKAR